MCPLSSSPVFAAFAVVVATLLLARCVPGGGAEATTAAAVAKQANAVVIDVRNQDEWDEGHLPTSTLMPLPSFADRLADVDSLTGGDKSRPIVVVCRSGNRAGKAKAILEKAGYTNVQNGGAWQNLDK